ncbi:MAG: 16S rRNA (cytosine(1402)-N(4))-methyltransferase RsmH [Clostridiales Family XIII bacterium]|jgi:16S rRNA (cytosine1402-N4)-methyltransferase|nr:16S rRNA (cytosine(1402)-N(4))-methyltransferase RsmH [Clostridiales Family XIII bacterium]
MDYSHKPVMYNEAMALLGVASRPGGVFADGTLGGGSHAAGICAALGPDGLLIGVDRDADALEASRQALEKFQCGKMLFHDNFKDIKKVLRDAGVAGLDGALLDLGVSSFQLDNPARGFSYMADAPLDMRMDASGDTGGLTAETVVNEYSRDELTRIFRAYGEERWASRISAFIAERRKKGPITGTGELVGIIKDAIPASARRNGPHPAKRVFQAIRIEVNEELSALPGALEDFMDCLNPGGRLCVITFHSLEDRIVKEAFARREDPCVCPKGLPACVCGKVADAKRLTRKPLTPSDEELESNPRARSAKLRAIEKLARP